MIGWRVLQKKMNTTYCKSKITPKLLKLLKIQYCILRQEKDLKKLNKIIKIAKNNKNIVACLIEKTLLNLIKQ